MLSVLLDSCSSVNLRAMALSLPIDGDPGAGWAGKSADRPEPPFPAVSGRTVMLWRKSVDPIC